MSHWLVLKMAWDVAMTCQLKNQVFPVPVLLTFFLCSRDGVSARVTSMKFTLLFNLCSQSPFCFLTCMAHFCSIEGQSVCGMTSSLYRRSTVSRQRKACIHRVCGTFHGAHILACVWEATSIEGMLSTPFRSLTPSIKCFTEIISLSYKRLENWCEISFMLHFYSMEQKRCVLCHQFVQYSWQLS